MSRVTLGIVLIAGLLLAGCGLQPGKSVSTYNRGNQAIVGEAPQDGSYALYKAGSTTPLATFTLKKGDKLGFRKGSDEKEFAVAGTNEVSIETSTLTRTFFWKLQK
jgi:hypothetical protein